MSTDLKDTLKSMLVDHLSIEADLITDEASFVKELDIDSLDAMDLLMAINEDFDIDIPPKEMDSIDNLVQLTAMVQSFRN